MSPRVITWRTTKTVDGYRFVVYSFAYQEPDINLKTGVYPTRAQATIRAKKWAMFFKRAQATKMKSGVAVFK